MIEVWKGLRDEFLERWTLAKIKAMTLSEYTNLNRDDSFTYWLESKTTDVLSIWGGSAYKFGIFKRDPQAEEKKLNKGQQTNGEYGWSTKFGADKYRAFENIKALIIEIIIAAQNKEFDKIDNIKIGPAVKWKIAFMYAPENTLLRIASEKAFKFLAQKHNIETNKISEVQKKLIAMKAQNEDFYEFSSRLWNEYYEGNLDKVQENYKEEINIPNIPLNQILYGPPGTGKTYNTINRAIEIIDNEFYLEHEEETPQNRKALKAKFEEYKKAGQIEFVTFHQSYGYEEFVEGIKAIPVGKIGNEDGNEMIYDVVSGTFKELALKAQKKKTISTTTQHKKYKLNAPMINIQAEMIQDDENSFRVLKGSKIRKAQTVSFNSSKLKKEILSKIDLTEESEYYILNEDYTFQSMSASSSIVLGRASNGHSAWKEVVDETLPINSIENYNKNHILIIDEINRGNISKIFGELITLIEPSKRIGEDEELRVRLPYSGEDGEPFGVPSNLYIIGTMNTADRSIAQIDTALRRRFVFEEMMPRAELFEDLLVDGIEIQKVLEAINERIEYIHDREHTIGHSYFLPLKKTPTKEKLDEIFRVNIIPLLAEYFYGDWGDIEFVLNNDFIQEKTENIYIKNSDKQLNRVYKVNETFETSEYIKIYNGDSE
ncbi:MAG: DUF4357 domain-containing protein [Campylobacterota bacterium]|nr:DUF4357 domain-containing protein [Campylobacterota bacterium]